MKFRTKNLLLTVISLICLAGCNNNNSSTSKNPQEYNDTIVNGGFEEGNLNGWTVKGLGAFNEENVSSDNLVNGVNSEKTGNYYFSGSFDSLPSFTGSLESDYFKLGGIGQLGLKIGAGKNGDNCYIQFFKLGSSEPLSFTLNGSTTQKTKLVNEDFNNTTITDQMIRQIVDLSEYLGDIIKIVITDNDSSGGTDYTYYSYLNVDDFVVINDASEKNSLLQERENQLIMYSEDDFEEDETSITLRNGGFELGDFTGWKVMSGDALTTNNIIQSSNKFWETRDYYAEGEYLLNGYESAENRVGTIRSEKFTLTENFVSFKIGGSQLSSCYVAVYDVTKGQEIARVSNDYFSDPNISLNLYDVILNLENYIGDVCYFIVSDNASSGPFGAITVDDFRINLTEEEVISRIAELKEMANSITESDSIKNAYVKLYNGGMSFPLAGNAPTIDLSKNEISIKAVDNFDLYKLLNEVDISDDYTSVYDLKKELIGLCKDGTNINVEDYRNFNLTNGNYELKIKVTDAYNQTTEATIIFEVSNDIVYNNLIENGNFETGDLTGWTVASGNVNVDNAVISDMYFWGENIPYVKEGTYHFDGWSACPDEAGTYSLRSTIFTLSGSGQISFKMGGRTAFVKVYTTSGQLIGYYQNTEFADVAFPNIAGGMRLANMVTYVADLSQYIGTDLYLEIGDEGTSNWGVAFFDNIVTYYEYSIDVSVMYDTYDTYSGSAGEFEGGTIAWKNAINNL